MAGFVSGIYKKWTYGIVLLIHAVSPSSSYKQYLSPFEGQHLLFFAAWPMLASCLMLYLLRDDDRWLSLGK